MNRKVIIGIGAIIALCCICSAVSIGVLVLFGSSGSPSGVPARCASVLNGSPEALLTDPLGGFARIKIDPAAPAGYQAFYKGNDGTIRVSVMNWDNPSKAKSQVKTMRDFISLLKPSTFSEKIGVAACDEFKYDGISGEDRAGMIWNNGAWLFIVGAKSAADRDAILKALPY
jgi:hypothetical protein